MTQLSTKPYLVRAIYDWCCDSGLTPYLAVKVNSNTRVPLSFVKDGEIVISLGVDAVKDLHLGSDYISCEARFGGVAHAVTVPLDAVAGIFAKESGQGLVFPVGESTPVTVVNPPSSPGQPDPTRPQPTKPHLRIVK